MTGHDELATIRRKIIRYLFKFHFEHNGIQSDILWRQGWCYRHLDLIENCCGYKNDPDIRKLPLNETDSEYDHSEDHK